MTEDNLKVGDLVVYSKPGWLKSVGVITQLRWVASGDWANVLWFDELDPQGPTWEFIDDLEIASL